MQTIRIIIVKRKLNYAKNEVTAGSLARGRTLQQTCYFIDCEQSLFFLLSSSSREKTSRLDELKRENRDCSQPSKHFKTVSPNTTMFCFNADNAAERKPRDRRSASFSSIPGLQWFNKLFNRAMARNVAPSFWPGPGLVNTIFAES